MYTNLSVSSAVVCSFFLCIPDNSMTLCSFCQLFLHSDTETTDNMFHIQQYCPGQAFGMYSILGWWQLFRYLSGLNTLIVEIVLILQALNLQSVLTWHTVGRKSWQGPLQEPSQLRKLLQKAHSQLIQLVAELVKAPLGWYLHACHWKKQVVMLARYLVTTIMCISLLWKLLMFK